MKKLCSLFLAGAALALAGCASAPMHGEAPMVRAMPVAAPATAGKTEVLWLGQATTRITTPRCTRRSMAPYAAVPRMPPTALAVVSRPKPTSLRPSRSWA